MAKSAEKYCLTQVSRQAQMEAAFSSCSAVGNLFVGKVSCGTTMNQTKGLDSVFKSCSRYAGLIGPCFPLSPTASLRVVGRECHTPLPDWSGRRKPFVQGWTHTSCRLRRFFKTPPTVEPVDENLFPGVDTHTEPFSARSK